MKSLVCSCCDMNSWYSMNKGNEDSFHGACDMNSWYDMKSGYARKPWYSMNDMKDASNFFQKTRSRSSTEIDFQSR